jgi:hypothetical protein
MNPAVLPQSCLGFLLKANVVITKVPTLRQAVGVFLN